MQSIHLPADGPSPYAILSGLLFIFISIKWITIYQSTAKVPGVGYPKFPLFASWVAAYRFLKDPVRLVREGIEKYKWNPFRISTLQGEYVLIPSRDMVSEYIRAADSVLSFQDGANDQQQIPFTMGYGVAYRTYHVPVIRKNLTKSIERGVESVWEEINCAFDDMIGSPAEYQPFSLYGIMAMTIARVSNRLFVNEQFARNKEYLQLAVDYAEAVVVTAELLRPFPDWMKRILVMAMPVSSCRRRAIKHLRQVVQECLDRKPGEEKPDTLIQWLADEAPPVERKLDLLVERIMALNVASIHTTTMTLSGALHNLAAEPDKYLPELREEVAEYCADGPPTKEIFTQLSKIDSFLKEAGRFNNAGLMSMQRNAKQQFTFSDGTIIPAGAKIGTPSLNLHRDPIGYEDPDAFDGFRFSRKGDTATSPRDAAKFSMVNTAADYQLFGHGKHACPGRFYAVNEMKLMLAILISRYEIKSVPGTSPNQTFLATMAIPDTQLKTLVKLRGT